MQFSPRVTSHHELMACKFDEVVLRLELFFVIDQTVYSCNKLVLQFYRKVFVVTVFSFFTQDNLS